MSRYEIEGNPPISVILRRSARARRLSLRVSRLDGRVTLTLPQKLPVAEAHRFADERADWIRKHLADIAPEETVTHGASLPIEGRDVVIAPGIGRRIELVGDQLHVPGAPDQVAARVRAYLKTRARDQLARDSDRFAAAVGRRYTKITLRDTRSRWGSCSSAGHLMYSWRLIMAPPEVLTYVAAHEVAHLVEMNHSPAFWAVVERLFPDHRTCRNWLRDHGQQLHKYRFGD